MMIAALAAAVAASFNPAQSAMWPAYAVIGGAPTIQNEPFRPGITEVRPNVFIVKNPNRVYDVEAPPGTRVLMNERGAVVIVPEWLPPEKAEAILDRRRVTVNFN